MPSYSTVLRTTITSIALEDPITRKLTKVEVKLYSQRPFDSCMKWLDVLHVFCTHLDRRIAYTMAFYADREMIRPQFMEEMFTATGILRDVATWIFDRYGRLREEHKFSPKNPQVEDWNSSLDDGAFVILHSFWVAEEWRRKGLARKMIDTIVKKVQAIETPALSILAVPGSLQPEVFYPVVSHNAILQPYSPHSDGINAKLLLWSMGLRRIGMTPCFATRIDPGGKQYYFDKSIYEDPDDDSSISKLVQNEGRWVDGLASVIGLPFGNWEYQVQRLEFFPILHATATKSDDELRDWYFELGDDFEAEDWVATDDMGRNILHLAIISFKFLSIDWLLQALDVGICNELKTTRNDRGYTPLQELHWRLEELRLSDGESVLSDEFRGFNKDCVNCLAMLECLEFPQPEDVLPQRPIGFYFADFHGLVQDLQAKFRLNIPWCKTKDYEGLRDHDHFVEVVYNAP